MEENEFADVVIRIERGDKYFVKCATTIECPFCGQYLKVKHIGFPKTYDTTHDIAERIFHDSDDKIPIYGTAFITKDRVKQEVELFCDFCHGVEAMILVGDEIIVSKKIIN